MTRAGRHLFGGLASRGRVALTGSVLLGALLSLGSSGGIVPDARAAIPTVGAWCQTSTTNSGGIWATKPTLFAFGGRQKLGEVTPGTYAWVNGYSARLTRVQLGCPKPGGGWLLSPPAEWASKNGCTDALCPVPAAQDFR